jgi:hypothetical protein
MIVTIELGSVKPHTSKSVENNEATSVLINVYG